VGLACRDAAGLLIWTAKKMDAPLPVHPMGDPECGRGERVLIVGSVRLRFPFKRQVRHVSVSGCADCGDSPE